MCEPGVSNYLVVLVSYKSTNQPITGLKLTLLPTIINPKLTTLFILIRSDISCWIKREEENKEKRFSEDLVSLENNFVSLDKNNVDNHGKGWVRCFFQHSFLWPLQNASLWVHFPFFFICHIYNENKP